MKQSYQLPHLETFAKAAELSCFSAAARALGLTQAAVSQRIGVLEQTLGTALFQRLSGRVLLSDAGRCLFPYAQQILALHQQARAEVTGKKPALSGQLSLAASSIPGEHILPALLASFRGKYPHVQVRVSVADSLVVLDHVEHGKAHLGLVGRKNDSPHLEFQSIACDEMVLVVPSSHPWARRKRIALARLGSVPLILREVGSGSRWCLEQALTAAGRSLADLQIALELGSNEAIKEAVLQGMGLAILSSRAVQKELRTGELHALKLTGLDLKRDLFVVWDRRRVLPIPAKLFLDLLEAAPSASSEGH